MCNAVCFCFLCALRNLMNWIVEEKACMVSSSYIEVMRRRSYIQSIRPRSSSIPRGRWHKEQRAKSPPACGSMFPRSRSWYLWPPQKGQGLPSSSRRMAPIFPICLFIGRSSRKRDPSSTLLSVILGHGRFFENTVEVGEDELKRGDRVKSSTGMINLWLYFKCLWR